MACRLLLALRFAAIVAAVVTAVLVNGCATAPKPPAPPPAPPAPAKPAPTTSPRPAGRTVEQVMATLGVRRQPIVGGSVELARAVRVRAIVQLGTGVV
jgi:hypothetical protein